ncbi:MAG TPA: hypothetical protein VH482_05765, partial [Thermomicrobiales bacterium]
AETVIVRSDGATADDPAFQQAVQSVADGLRAITVVADLTTYYEAVAEGAAGADAYLSPDRHDALITVTFAGSASELMSHADTYLQVIKSHDSPDIRVLSIGDLSVGKAILTATSLGDPCGPEGNFAYLPSDDLKEAYRALLRDFPAGQPSTRGATTEIVVDGPIADPAVQSAIKALEVALSMDTSFGPAKLTQNDVGDLAVIDVPMTIDPCSSDARELVSRLRSTVIPTTLGGVPASVYVTGTTATSLDATES